MIGFVNAGVLPTSSTGYRSSSVCNGSLRHAAVSSRSFSSSPASLQNVTVMMQGEPGNYANDEFTPDQRMQDDKKLFVGNLSWDTNSGSLQEAFAEFGEVTYAHVVTDKVTSRSKGFGFVEFAEPASASAALEAMNGRAIDGRAVRVDRANQNRRIPRGTVY